MKRYFQFLVIAIIILLFSLSPPAADGQSGLEQSVVNELNMARTNPGGYARYLEDFKRNYAGKYINIPGQTPIVTREGAAAVNEAIEFLKSTSPLPRLRVSRGLSKAARDHVRNQGPTGMTGHRGADGSTPETRISRYGQWRIAYGENIEYGNDTARQIVMQLIIDDGVPGRGHRNNIFKRAFKVVGVGCGPHHAFRSMCVMDFAGSFVDD